MADVSELVIQIRATTEGFEATLENASQLVRKFAREAEAAISKPIEVDMQTDSLKDVISGMMGLGKETKNAFNASTILKAGLLDLGSSIVTGGINALIGLVIQGIATLFRAAAEAKKKQEEARQEAIKNSEEMARKFSDAAQNIRALGEEYAKLGSKIRTASEEKTFLDLQADLAAALGITEDALKSQIQTLDDYYQKIAEAERRNAGQAAGEYRKAAQSRQETDEYTKLVILAYLLSKPDDWKVIVGDVVKHAADGKTAVYTGLDELRRLGHYDKVPIRSEDGRRIHHWESTVYELPKAVNPDEAPLSLLPGFQEIDNQELDDQDIENRERKNNYKTKNDSTNNDGQSCPSGRRTQGADGQTDHDGQLRALEPLLKGNIGYSDFLADCTPELALVDEILAVMVDVFATSGEYITIDRENRPRELVKRRLLEVGRFHVEHVMGQFAALTVPVKRKRQYLLTMLYNSTMELDAHHTNGASARRSEA